MGQSSIPCPLLNVDHYHNVVYFTGNLLVLVNSWLSRAITMYHEDAEGILVVVDKGDEVRA